jgi:ABC-type antimicrobial peptide transport system permease subunit
MIDDVRAILDEQGDKVDGYAVVSGYDTSLVDYYDASAGRHLSSSQRSNLSWVFDYSEGRGLDSNLPDVSFREGRNLDPVLDSEPMPDDVWPCVVLSMEFVDSTFGSLGSFMPGVGDQITLDFYGTRDEPITFEIVGVVNETGIVFSDASLYAPLDAFGDRTSDSAYIIADVPEENVRDVRRALVQVPGAFVFETRLINDLLNRVVDQFTSFPILVAALALVTGGIVIANSVALSTLERRREIGVMKAVGLQRERVLGMLLLENGLMGLVGGLIGVGISFIAIVLLLSQIFDDELGDTIPYMTAFSLMALCIVISLTAAILSVWGASGEKPLNVLRYE